MLHQVESNLVRWIESTVESFHLPSAHALLNIESFVALGFLLAILARSNGREQVDGAPNRHLAVDLILCGTILVVYWRVLGAPFLFDDYTHITDAHNASWRTILAAFGPVEHKPGLFYRPFAFLVYWLNYLVAGPDPRLWHATSLLFHAADCCLLYALCRALRLSRPGSFGAALLFAVSGAATESVAWIDARFDPMTTGFVLATLLFVCRFLHSGRLVWMMAACAACAAAITSKESAFCLPLLVACLWFFGPGGAGSRPAKIHMAGREPAPLTVSFVGIATVTAVLFVNRWWALGGMGGYRSATGDSNIARFSPIRMLNAIFVRDWTILFFPVNWSESPNWLLNAFLFLTPIVLAICVWQARIPRRVFWGCVALTISAALPVQHLLLIGTDLANSRYVYLLSIGWAVLWGSIFTAIPKAGWRAFAISWMLAWHLLMVHHNLAFWLRVPEEARQVCTEFARTVSTMDGTAVVGGLPSRKSGVVFLANGFPECVAMNSGFTASRVSVYGTPNFVWNDATSRIEPVGPGAK